MSQRWLKSLFVVALALCTQGATAQMPTAPFNLSLLANFDSLNFAYVPGSGLLFTVQFSYPAIGPAPTGTLSILDGSTTIWTASASTIRNITAVSLPHLSKLLQSYQQGLQNPIYVVGFGSSVGVGATLPNPSVDAPVNYFMTSLKSAVDPGGIYNFQVSNQSVNGTIAFQFPAAWTTMLEVTTTPAVCVFVYGMNDGQVAEWSSGETFPGFYSSLLSAIQTCKLAGADVVIMQGKRILMAICELETLG
jgi:hypothetical protein